MRSIPRSTLRRSRARSPGPVRSRRRSRCQARYPCKLQFVQRHDRSPELTCEWTESSLFHFITKAQAHLIIMHVEGGLLFVDGRPAYVDQLPQGRHSRPPFFLLCISIVVIARLRKERGPRPRSESGRARRGRASKHVRHAPLPRLAGYFRRWLRCGRCPE